MTYASANRGWTTAGVLVGRLLFGGVFALATTMKFSGMTMTAAYIGQAGFPAPVFLAWAAAFLELGLALAFFAGAFFTEAALLGAAYVLFLAVMFHGPAHWSGNQVEFGFFVDHLTFIAGLLFAAVHGPGAKLKLGWHLLPERRLAEVG